MKDIFYFLLGAMVGAIFGLLFAPQSGEELRSNIQSTAEKDWGKLQVQWQAELQDVKARLAQLQAAQDDAPQEETPADAPEESAAGEAA